MRNSFSPPTPNPPKHFKALHWIVTWVLAALAVLGLAIHFAPHSRFVAFIKPIGPFILYAFIICEVVYIAGALILKFRSVEQERLTSRRIQNGLCVRCGYNLCASKDRCPECGEIPPQDG